MMDNSDPIIANGNSVPNGNSQMMDSSEPIIANGYYVPNGNSSEPIIANGNYVPNGNSSEPIIANGNYVTNGNSSEPIIANGNAVPNGHSVPNEPIASSSLVAQEKPRILLAACGCVTAAKFVDLCREFSEWAEVKAVITKPSSEFIDLHSLVRDIDSYCDEHELRSWRLFHDYAYVLHNALASWAEILVIAPLSAHTLAKIDGGLCDNLLSSIVRAWDYRKPIFVAPSMNKFMWTNPITVKQCMSIEEELGITLIQPNVENDCSMAETHIINSTVKLCYDSQA